MDIVDYDEGPVHIVAVAGAFDPCVGIYCPLIPD